MSYQPKPLHTSEIELPADLRQLTETLAENAHDEWALQRMADGWTYGPQRDDARKTHPGLVPYRELTETEKEYDRITAMKTLKAIIALGYDIAKKS